ncbi:hypothetical protein K491DRAFT_584037 [Lophiostoma macrostomum CBS 122681]|uniref:Uncharacterized protein n=1 Tax=Lophiostoma macrostomum CBS 122681 TaxID=1314788 RepID=A0A6A6TSA0_9PLEO|nr:hypothetical protein K491DRAFT_584037 [Lophiostoma macrostomum CBS 122681]
MPDPTIDDALLARLNALKKSSVTFDTTPSASILPTTPSKPSSAPDDLAARFARLGSASPSASPKPPDAAKGPPVIAPGAPSYLEGIAEGLGGGEGEGNVQFNDEDEKSLEELLGELRDRGQWDLNRDEQRDVGSLVRDAKRLMPVVQQSIAEKNGGKGVKGGVHGTEDEEGLTDWENVEVDIGSGGVQVGRDDEDKTEDDNDGDDEGSKKHTEDQEADDIIARVMAELDISTKYRDLEEPPDQGESKEQNDEVEDEKQESASKEGKSNSTPSEDPVSLPSAPSTLPQDDLATTQAIEDALTVRLAALSKPHPSSTSDPLGLPSAPSFAPSNKPPKVTSSNFPKYADEEIDTWCIICTDDATLKCLGCDNDLYCQKCWMEGHRGESAGFEERRHRAVMFSRKKGERKVAAAAG